VSADILSINYTLFHVIPEYETAVANNYGDCIFCSYFYCI